MLYNYLSLFKVAVAMFIIVLVKKLISIIENNEDSSNELVEPENLYRYNIQGKSVFPVELPKNSIFIILM